MKLRKLLSGAYICGTENLCDISPSDSYLAVSDHWILITVGRIQQEAWKKWICTDLGVTIDCISPLNGIKCEECQTRMWLWKLVAFEPLKVGGSPFFRCATRALAFVLSWSQQNNHITTSVRTILIGSQWKSLAVQAYGIRPCWARLAPRWQTRQRSSRERRGRTIQSHERLLRFINAGLQLLLVSRLSQLLKKQNPRRGSMLVRLLTSLSLHCWVSVKVEEVVQEGHCHEGLPAAYFFLFLHLLLIMKWRTWSYWESETQRHCHWCCWTEFCYQNLLQPTTLTIQQSHSFFSNGSTFFCNYKPDSLSCHHFYPGFASLITCRIQHNTSHTVQV